MNIYKTPDSNSEKPESLQFKPVNAICYGLLIAVVLTMIVSTVEAMAFAAIIAITQLKVFPLIFLQKIRCFWQLI